MGNLHSLAKSLRRAAPEGTDIVVTADPAVLAACERLVLPGVGSAGGCMAELGRHGLDQLVKDQAAAGVPLLGVCLGMQVLASHSEENGGVATLNLLPGTVTRFARELADADGARLKVPHMGWNRVRPTRPHAVWEGVEDGAWFYFVHSYHAVMTSADDVAATTDYPGPVTAAIGRGNIVAMQFHPEKSHAAGIRLLANFLHWSP